MRHRVVITGLGAVSAAGYGADVLWEAARDGRSGARRIAFERREPQRVTIAAHLPDFAPGKLLGDRLAASIDRFTAFALVAADEACAQAGLSVRSLDDRAGVVFGSGAGGAMTFETGVRLFATTEARGDPMTVPKFMPNAAASHISMRYATRGPCLCISTACASATQAIGIGAHMVRSGLIDIAIVGGAEAPLGNACFRAWEILRVLSPTACRPFSLHRDGMMLGEGAAVLVLESETSARQRGATILGELAGYGTSSDAGDMLRPDPAGAARAMANALADAGLTAADIHYVNAHGTGTIANDIAETQALKQAFGDSFSTIPVSSTKPIHGHALGASGAFELVVTVKALAEQMLPPTINWLGTDPKCAVAPITQARSHIMTAAMSNSLAFGGINGSLIVRSAS